MPIGVPDTRKKTKAQLSAAVMYGEITATIDGTLVRQLSRRPDGFYQGQLWDKETGAYKWRVWGEDGSTIEGLETGLSLCSSHAVHVRECNDRKNKK